MFQIDWLYNTSLTTGMMVVEAEILTTDPTRWKARVGDSCNDVLHETLLKFLCELEEHVLEDSPVEFLSDIEDGRRYSRASLILLVPLCHESVFVGVRIC